MINNADVGPLVGPEGDYIHVTNTHAYGFLYFFVWQKKKKKKNQVFKKKKVD